MADGGSAIATEDGCCFTMTSEGGGHGTCNAPRRRGSAYCAEHHAACHTLPGSAAEKRRIAEIEALATIVGGRRGAAASQPPPRLLRRLIRVERRFS